MGHYVDAKFPSKQVSLQWANLNLNIDFVTRNTTNAFSAGAIGTKSAFIAATSTGTAGFLAPGLSGSLTTAPYTFTSDAWQYTFKVGGGKEGVGVHTWKAATAAVYADALASAEILEEYAFLQKALGMLVSSLLELKQGLSPATSAF